MYGPNKKKIYKKTSKFLKAQSPVFCQKDIYTMEIHLRTFVPGWCDRSSAGNGPMVLMEWLGQLEGWMEWRIPKEKNPCSSNSWVFSKIFLKEFSSLLFGDMIPYDSQVDVAHIFQMGENHQLVLFSTSSGVNNSKLGWKTVAWNRNIEKHGWWKILIRI